MQAKYLAVGLGGALAVFGGSAVYGLVRDTRQAMSASNRVREPWEM